MTNADYLRNVDETEVESEFGRYLKVFGSSDTNYGGSRASSSVNSTDKHMKAFLPLNAPGKKGPIFLILARKQIRSSCFSVLDKNVFKNPDGSDFSLHGQTGSQMMLLISARKVSL